MVLAWILSCIYYQLGAWAWVIWRLTGLGLQNDFIHMSGTSAEKTGTTRDLLGLSLSPQSLSTWLCWASSQHGGPYMAASHVLAPEVMQCHLCSIRFVPRASPDSMLGDTKKGTNSRRCGDWGGHLWRLTSTIVELVFEPGCLAPETTLLENTLVTTISCCVSIRNKWIQSLLNLYN